MSASTAWVDEVAAFRTHLADSGRAAATASSYIATVRALGRGVGCGPWEVDRDLLRRWLDEQEWTTETRRRRLAGLRVFYAWGVDRGACETSPAAPEPTLEQPISDNVRWVSALEEFSAYLAASSRAPLTSAGYVRHVQWLADSVDVGPWELTTRELAAWIEERAWSKQTRRQVLVSLRTFWAWGVSTGKCQWAPLAGLPSATPRKRGSASIAMPPGWSEHVEAFCAFLRAGGRAEGTIRQYLWRLRKLAEVAADPWAVTTPQLEQWLSTVDWGPETKKTARSAVRVFYEWAERHGYIDRSPAHYLPTVKVPRALPKPAPIEALREALAAADDRLRLMLMLAALAGLRRAEIATLHTSSIADDHLIIVGKGGHHRMVPLHPLLAEELRVELGRRRRGQHGTGWSGRFVSETGYLFPSDLSPDPITPDRVGVLVRNALPGSWSTHSLRHRFATSAYQQQRDLRAVQELLGHAKPETTARYAAVPDGALMAAVMGAGI